MVKLNFAHLCEYASILQNGTPIIIGIFSEISASSLPVTRINTALVLNFNIDDKDSHRVKITIKSPSGKEIMTPFQRDIGPVKDVNQNLGIVLSIGNIKIEEEGMFNVEIIVDDKVLRKLPFTFSISKK